MADWLTHGQNDRSQVKTNTLILGLVIWNYYTPWIFWKPQVKLITTEQLQSGNQSLSSARPFEWTSSHVVIRTLSRKWYIHTFGVQKMSECCCSNFKFCLLWNRRKTGDANCPVQILWRSSTESVKGFPSAHLWTRTKSAPVFTNRILPEFVENGGLYFLSLQMPTLGFVEPKPTRKAMCIERTPLSTDF